MNKCFLTIILSVLLLVATYGQEMPKLPPVGTIDFYGLRRVSETDVLRVLKIETGDDAIETLKAVEENRRLLKTLPNVEDASVSLVCCDDASGKSIVFVGIRERGEPVLTFRRAPNGSVKLPETILRAGRDFQTAFALALQEKDFSEDDSAGHAFLGNRVVRDVQQRFISLAAQNLSILRRALRESSRPDERALAAQIIPYYSDKKRIVADLLYAAEDANESVRNNAARALIVLAKYARANPQLKIKIPADIFIPMLASLQWTDRNKAVGVLDELTKTRDAALLSRLKKHTVVPLAEMARWTSPGHAQSAFFVLGRIAGFSEEEIAASWKTANREEQIQKFFRKITSGLKSRTEYEKMSK